MRAFEYFLPQTLEEVPEILIKCGKEAILMAGGTDLIVRMKEGEINPKFLIDLKKIPNLNKIEWDGESIKIGALTTVRQIESSPIVKEKLGVLSEAASVLGSLQIRNKGTVGGNLCHASPSADLAPPLIALDGEGYIRGKNGERKEALENFFVGPGLTILNPDEILTEIQIPIPLPNTNGTYLKFSPRKAMDLAVVGVATLITLDSLNFICTHAKIVLGAVAPIPMRAKKAEALLEGRKIEDGLVQEASQVAAEESKPISDIRGSAWYRKELVRVLVERSITQAIEKIKL